MNKTDRNGHSILYVYDALNRLTHKGYPDSTGVDYVYDLAGKIRQVSDPTGLYGFAYDNMGRLIGITTQYSFLPGSSSITFSNAYAYDAASNRTSLTLPDGSTDAYAYDALNRMTTLTDSLTGQFGFGYDTLSRRTSLNRPNGVNTNYSYNSASRLLSVLHKAGSSTVDGASYTYDNAGNRMAKANQLNSVAEQYVYDAIYELTQVSQGTTTTESYTYDAVGNRLSSLSVPSYNYSSSNELTSTPNLSFTYDNNGNTLSKTSSGATTQYTWDFENRLSSVVLPGSGGTVTFKYDPFVRRIQKSSANGTTNYLYDGVNVVEEINSTGALVARYTQNQGVDEALAQTRSGTTAFYEQDALGSVTSLSNAGGTLVNTYTYDSFGNLTASTGTLVNPFQYTGRDYDSETGVRYYRARYYDPAIGRFLSEDPIGLKGGIDFYVYVSNSPVNTVDPLGLLGDGPKLPSVPTGKAGCYFVGEVTFMPGPCKTCMYRCGGYGATVPFPQAKGKPCPSIDPVSGLVNTGEIDPICLGGWKAPTTEPKKCPEPRFKPLPIPVVGPGLDKILDPIAGFLQDRLNELVYALKHPPKPWGPPLPWGPPNPMPGPIPIVP